MSNTYLRTAPDVTVDQSPDPSQCTVLKGECAPPRATLQATEKSLRHRFVGFSPDLGHLVHCIGGNAPGSGPGGRIVSPDQLFKTWRRIRTAAAKEQDTLAKRWSRTILTQIQIELQEMAV